MGLSYFSVWVLFCSSFLGWVQVFVAEGAHAYARNYISWDDLKVNNRHKVNINSRHDNVGSRIIVVDKNGGGNSVTIQGAVNMVPQHNSERVKIHIRPGIYREKVFVPRSKPYISFIGSENRAAKTVITWSNKASDRDSTGGELGTYRSATLAVESNYFCASGITFENTVVAVPGGHGMQAVALRIAGNKAMFYKVRVLGTQDTLLDETGSHYFYQCHIQGSIDFIFGSSKSLYQDCVLKSIAQYYGAIAAHHRDSPHDDTGFSFVNCTITGSGSVLLGRAWGDYARTIYSYCYMENIITPSGWNDWNHPLRRKTVMFGEYKNRGRGANTRGRVPWSKSFHYEEARPFLDRQFINGDQWLRL
ncbi:Pectinesterase [Quillaja saponaria]|uniref:Pectinesterase n=1 Tax=Quillaja saponaria TaxID=32244 RepID=A0AAD7LSR6_QUISA|nr:Pectinesterase [Quillaja saponaria]